MEFGQRSVHIAVPVHAQRLSPNDSLQLDWLTTKLKHTWFQSENFLLSVSTSLLTNSMQFTADKMTWNFWQWCQLTNRKNWL